MDVDNNNKLAEGDHMCVSAKTYCLHQVKRTLLSLLQVAAVVIYGASFTGQVVAQVPVPWGIEAPLTAIDPSAGTISVSNMKVKIPP